MGSREGKPLNRPGGCEQRNDSPVTGWPKIARFVRVAGDAKAASKGCPAVGVQIAPTDVSMRERSKG